MQDFVRIIMKRGHEDWQSRLNKISSLQNEAELQMVAKGFRQATTAHLSQDNINRLLPRLNKLGLYFTPIAKSGYYQGFAHRHKEVKPGDPFYWYGCVTRTVTIGEIFKAADMAADHKAVGRLLGYPECCTEYFARAFPKDYDPIWLGLSGEVHGYPACNQMLRYFGPRITSHLSCSPDCKATDEFGRIWLEVMRTIDPEAADDMLHILSKPFTWDSYHGVVQVETDYFVGLTHTSMRPDSHRIICWKGEDNGTDKGTGDNSREVHATEFQ